MNNIDYFKSKNYSDFIDTYTNNYLPQYKKWLNKIVG